MSIGSARVLRGFCLYGMAALAAAALLLSPNTQVTAGGGIAGGPSLATGFEPGQGYVPGWVDGQKGWVALAGAAEPHIDTVAPFNGVQHLRLSRDPGLSAGTVTGAVSPNLGLFTETSGTVSVEVQIHGGGIRDYWITPQSATEGQIVTEVLLRRDFDIYVKDDLGAGATFVNTGFTWTPDVYKNLTIDLDFGAGQFTVHYDGVLVYTNVGPGLPFATSIQEVMVRGQNGTADEDADFDDFAVVNGPDPTGACCNADGANGCMIRTIDECHSLHGLYLGNNTLCADCPFVPLTCALGAGDCNDANGTPGCENVSCCVLVCETMPTCCVVAWDAACADAACDFACPLPAECGACGTGDCFIANGSPFCDDNCGPAGLCLGCCQAVCIVDPFCCDDEWDGLCAGEAIQQCTCQPEDAPANDDCVDATPIVIGGTPVTNQCATAGGPDHDGCNDGFVAGLGLDIWYSYVATFDGALSINPVVNSSWHTQLALYEGCDCGALEDPPLLCAPIGGGATLEVTQGTCYLIRLGGTFDGPTGIGTLELGAAPDACSAGVGDCNAAHATAGCSDLSCCVSICLADPACCDTGWDQACADLANVTCVPVPCGPLDTASATQVEAEACGDDTNGGCNSTPPAFMDVLGGQIVHGTAWASAGTRDTDTYRLFVSVLDDLNGDGFVDLYYNIRGELPVAAVLVEDPNAPPGCTGGLNDAGSIASSQTCEQVGIGFATVTVGTYYITVGAADADGSPILDGYPCGGGPGGFGNDYLLCVTVVDSGTPSDPSCGTAPVTCTGDCGDQNGVVNTVDFLALLGQWGLTGTNCDLAGTEPGVDTVDFLLLLGAWGPCN